MKPLNIFKSTCAFIIFFVALGSYAAKPLPSHFHGVANSNISINYGLGQIQAELLIPTHDVLGFEHHPSTEKEKKLYSDIKAYFSNKESVVTFFDPLKVQCKQIQLNLKSPYDGKKEKKRRFAKKARGLRSKKKSKHTDFHWAAVYQCKNLDELLKIEFDVFEKFDALQKLWVNTASEKGQKSYELGPKKRYFDIL